MRWRPILVSAAISGAAALALVMSESAMMGAHVSHPSGGGQASVPKTDSGNGGDTAVNGTLDNAQNPSGASGADTTTDSPPDQQPAEQPNSGQSNSGGINPLGTVQQLVPKPGPVPITR